jgi:hypothetical protein
MCLEVNDPACMPLYAKQQRPLQSACEAALTGLHCAWSVMAACPVGPYARPPQAIRRHAVPSCA